MKRTQTSGIVLHRCEVWRGNDYHFVVLRDGSVKLLVPVDDVAYHALSFNKESIAIAVYGDFASSEPGLNWHPTIAQLTTVRTLIAQVKARYGKVTWIAGHSELGKKGTAFPTKLVAGHTCPGENFPLQEIIIASGLTHLPPGPVSPILVA